MKTHYKVFNFKQIKKINKLILSLRMKFIKPGGYSNDTEIKFEVMNLTVQKCSLL